MKFFQVSLLFAAAEAASLMSYHDSHHHHEPEVHDTEHTHTKTVTKVVPVTTYVEKEVHGVTEEEVTKLVDTIEYGSEDSGDHIDSDEYVPSVHAVDGSKHCHNCGEHGLVKVAHGHHGHHGHHGYHGYGHGYGLTGAANQFYGHHATRYGLGGYGYYGGYGYGHHGYGYGHHGYGHHGYTKYGYVRAADDHTHSDDGDHAYVHSHTSVEYEASITADSSADERVVQKEVTEVIEVPTVDIVKVPKTTYEKKQVEVDYTHDHEHDHDTHHDSHYSHYRYPYYGSRYYGYGHGYGYGRGYGYGKYGYKW